MNFKINKKISFAQLTDNIVQLKQLEWLSKKLQFLKKFKASSWPWIYFDLSKLVLENFQKKS